MVSTRDSLRSWLRLSLTPGVGNKTARALLQSFGLPENIFECSASELQAIVSPTISQQLRCIPTDLEAAVEVTSEWLNTPVPSRMTTYKSTQVSAKPIGKRLLTLGDPDYPAASC